MKRWIAMLLAALLMLAGCNADTTPTEPDTTGIQDGTTESVQEPSTMPVFVPLPMITVSVPIMIDEVTGSDNTVIFRNIRQSIQLVMPDQEVADRVIIDFLSRIDQHTADAVQLQQQAASAYIPSDNWTPYLCSITYKPMRIDQCVLSLYGNSLRYSGGAHADNTSCAANYNVITGDVLTLGSILTDEAAKEKLCNLVIEELQAVAEEKYLRDGFEETVKNRFSTEESYDEDWFFSTSGLCFYFDQYAIAPYSSGIITAEISYNELIGIIGDAFFPPEIEEVNGMIMSSPADSTDMTQFTRISEIVVDAEAPMYVIYCDHAVQNLRISINDAEFGFYTIFAAQSLCASDAIVIQAEPGLFHQIDISYKSGDQTVTMPLLAE